MNRIAVCSWSLRPADPDELVELVRATGLDAVQLAIDPLRTGAWDEVATVATLAEAGISVVSGMMGMEGEDYSTLDTIRATGGLRPDSTWEANRAAAIETAAIAARLGLERVTFHAGFLPHEAGPERDTLLGRLREVADLFQAEGVTVGLETGQETAETLEAVLDELDHDGVRVNFDPANLILYGMGDPVEALDRLAPHVLQVHLKDARATTEPGTWGTEVPLGEGEVDWPAFVGLLRARGLGCDLAVEREAGERRVEDVRQAAERVRWLLGEST